MEGVVGMVEQMGEGMVLIMVMGIIMIIIIIHVMTMMMMIAQWSCRHGRPGLRGGDGDDDDIHPTR